MNSEEKKWIQIQRSKDRSVSRQCYRNLAIDMNDFSNRIDNIENGFLRMGNMLLEQDYKHDEIN